VGICAVFLVFLAGADSASAAGYERFFVEAGYDSEARESVRAEQLFSSRHARILVDSSYWNSLGEERKAQERVALAALITEFDGRIYPLTRELLGAEWNPGVDRDPRIVLLLTPMIEGTFGYARPFIDETRAEGSNEAEMVYVNARTLSSPRTKAELAASFAELIAYHERVIASDVPEAPWVLALAASYAPTHLGYDTPFVGSKLAGEVETFISSPSNSFLDWNGGRDDRASVSLFAHFIAGRYGTPFFGHLMRGGQHGERGITLALRDSGTKDTFEDVVSAWALASYANGTAVDGESYRYTHPALDFSRLRVTPEYRAPIGENSASSSRFALPPASAQWVRYTPQVLGTNGLNSLFLDIEGFDGATTTLSYIETAIDGTSRVETIRMRNGRGMARVDLFGTYVLSVVLVPVNRETTATTLRVEAYQRESDRDNAEGTLANGTLVRGKDSDKVFVIQNESRRWIQSTEIFAMYAHMRWEDVHEVPASTLLWYRESFLVRVEGDTKVYEVTPLGHKRWLDMTAGEFERSGRRWESVFVINEKELLWYADAQER
jgi:hypothetical protein